MEQITFPNYNNSILNIVASIQAYYQVPTNYPGLNLLSSQLKKNYQRVVLMIFDGLGVDIINHHLPPDSFLRNHHLETITSVYPPTTTAAMTAYYSGKSPLEHGWLGWSLYLKEYGRSVDLFTNRDSYDKQIICDRRATDLLLSYQPIYDQITKRSQDKVGVYTIIPHGITLVEGDYKIVEADDIAHMVTQLQELLAIDQSSFIMTYWPEPDAAMHEFGCYSDQAAAFVQEINRQVEALSKTLEDTLVIISADHGQIDITGEINLWDYPELTNCLILPPSIEPRAVSFFVKPERRDFFAKRFKQLFKEEFRLFTKEEVYQLHLLGHGTSHHKVDDTLGDFLACGIGTKLMVYPTLNGAERFHFLGHHAGLTTKEMEVPCIVFGEK